MKFSERLKNIRDKNAWTQQQIADRLVMSVRMYSYYENGKYDDSDKRKGKYLHKLADMENGKLDEFVSEKKPNTNESINEVNHLKEQIAVLKEHLSSKDMIIKLQEDTITMQKSENAMQEAEITALKIRLANKKKIISELKLKVESK